MIVVGESPSFAVMEVGRCRNCKQAIERRQIIGWVHVEGAFYVCLLPLDEDAPFLVANPEREANRVDGGSIQ
jgi:hypothetical protein